MPDNPGNRTPPGPPSGLVWRMPDGTPVACHEKLKVLNENFVELQQMLQDALEDAVLLGCSEAQVRAVFAEMIERLENPYREAQ
jgi:hypothetical protein